MRYAMLSVFAVVMVVMPTFFTSESNLEYSFDEQELRTYLPICTNNITADKLYARIVEGNTEYCYEYLLYWNNQSGTYKFAEHDFDWEFICVYADKTGQINQVNYDSWHYYIGRSTTFEAYNNTNVLMYVNPEFHNFVPDIGMRSGNISYQINNQTIYNLTSTILETAELQVGFDPELYENPFSWKEKGILGRYTAFNDWYKAFMIVSDKQFSFIDFEKYESSTLGTKWL